MKKCSIIFSVIFCCVLVFSIFPLVYADVFVHEGFGVGVEQYSDGVTALNVTAYDSIYVQLYLNASNLEAYSVGDGYLAFVYDDGVISDCQLGLFLWNDTVSAVFNNSSDTFESIDESYSFVGNEVVLMRYDVATSNVTVSIDGVVIIDNESVVSNPDGVMSTYTAGIDDYGSTDGTFVASVYTADIDNTVLSMADILVVSMSVSLMVGLVSSLSKMFKF